MATYWCWFAGAVTCSDAVIQALKHAGIPVAGADRLKLTEHIAIIDLMEPCGRPAAAAGRSGAGGGG
jgi:hypothetical protein